MILLGHERTAATTPEQGSLAVVGRGRGDLVSPPASNMKGNWTIILIGNLLKNLVLGKPV